MKPKQTLMALYRVMFSSPKPVAAAYVLERAKHAQHSIADTLCGTKSILATKA